MFIHIIISLISILTLRDIASFDECNLFKSYISTKSSLIAKLFSRKPKLYKLRKGEKEYRITYAGIVLYVITLLVILISFAVVLFTEEVPAPAEPSGRRFGRFNTFNEQYTVGLLASIMFFNAIISSLNKNYRKPGAVTILDKIMYIIFLPGAILAIAIGISRIIELL